MCIDVRVSRTDWQIEIRKFIMANRLLKRIELLKNTNLKCSDWRHKEMHEAIHTHVDR